MGWNRSRGVWIMVIGVATTSTVARGVRAESKAVAGIAVPSVLPPRLLAHPDVPYPSGAHGDAVVVLKVTVNADGSVRAVEAQSGEPPFDALAAQAVRGWRFEPATRDGQPIAATIRFELQFRAPPAAEPPPAPIVSAPATNVPAAASPPPVPLEITVQGEPAAPAAVALGIAEVRQIPGAFGDPFRAVEILPGVAPTVSGLPYFYVRGAPPSNVGYYLDGIRVPFLFHLLAGPSVVNPAMVERVDLYAGGYPAAYGRNAGGIVAARTTTPSTTLRGAFNIRLLDAGAMVEGGFADGRGTALVGGRYSYTGLLISLLAKDVRLDYRDYQLRLTYDVTPDDRLSFLAFGAYDAVVSETKDVATVGFGAEFYRAQIGWDKQLGDDVRLSTTVSFGYDQTRLLGDTHAQERSLHAATGLQKRWSKAVLLRAGLDAERDRYRFGGSNYVDPDTPAPLRFGTLFRPRSDSVVGGYVDAVVEPTPGVSVTPGVRVDYFSSRAARQASVEPRVASKWRATEKLAIVQAFGVARQLPSAGLPLPGLSPTGLAQGLQTAYQNSVGVEWHGFESIELASNVFYDVFSGMTDNLRLTSDAPTYDPAVRTKGRAYGWELSLHRKLTERFGGFLSYTLGRSVRSRQGAEVPSAFDRRHVLNAALSHELGRHWRLGGRLLLYSGVPRAPQPGRAPVFYRIDTRLEKLWKVGRSGHVSFVVEVLNVTGSKEHLADAEAPVVWPSIGVEGGF